MAYGGGVFGGAWHERIVRARERGEGATMNGVTASRPRDFPSTEPDCGSSCSLSKKG